MKTLNLNEAIRLAKEVVTEHGPENAYSRPEGGFNSGSCVYIADGKPSCIVGQILHRAGWTTELLSDVQVNATRIEAAYSNMFDKNDEYVITDRTVRFLEVMQDLQDEGYAWGKCLDAGLEHIEARFFNVPYSSYRFHPLYSSPYAMEPWY